MYSIISLIFICLYVICLLFVEREYVKKVHVEREKSRIIEEKLYDGICKMTIKIDLRNAMLQSSLDTLECLNKAYSAIEFKKTKN